MEEVERLSDHIVIMDHGQVIADETPAALYQRLPAKAALEVDLAQPLSAEQVEALGQHAGVTQVTAQDKHLQIALAAAEGAWPVLDWLAQQGAQLLHFATARTKLEDIFLTLTGRSLRDGP